MLIVVALEVSCSISKQHYRRFKESNTRSAGGFCQEHGYAYKRPISCDRVSFIERQKHSIRYVDMLMLITCHFF